MLHHAHNILHIEPHQMLLQINHCIINSVPIRSLFFKTLSHYKRNKNIPRNTYPLCKHLMHSMHFPEYSISSEVWEIDLNLFTKVILTKWKKNSNTKSLIPLYFSYAHLKAGIWKPYRCRYFWAHTPSP